MSAKPKILISDSLSTQAVQTFEDLGCEVTVSGKLTPQELAHMIPDYDGLAVRSATKVTAELLEKASNLKVVGRAGIGVDNIDVNACTRNGVVVMNTPFGNAITTAEHAIAMMFALARHIPQANASTHEGKWEKSRFMGTELTGKTLGLVGAGNIGSIVARKAIGIGLKVLAFDPFLSEERAKDLGVTKVELDELFTKADVITLHVPKTAQTENMIDANALNKMKKGVMLVNCARGGLVDELALLAALETGHVRGAALDVFAVEPAKENPLFGHPGVICTPHLGASTQEAQEKVAVQVAEQMANYLVDGAVQNALNTPSLSAEDARKLGPWIDLAKQLGSMIGQLTDEEIIDMQIEYCGDASGLKHEPITNAALAAILGTKFASVNLVNVRDMASQRGINVKETRTDSAGDYQAVVRIVVSTPDYRRSIAGTMMAGRPRITEIKGIQLESTLGRYMLYITNKDTPGLIGAVGSRMAESGINIANFHLGRLAAGGDAIAFLEIDSAVSEDDLSTLQGLPQIDRCRFLEFPELAEA